jgi:uncharacterized protein (UPF0264 family)
MNLPINQQILHKVHKTQLLISVTSIEEAQIALENGADIIDLKEPSAGALGALPIERIQAIVAYVKSIKEAGAMLTSATIGDLPMQPNLLIAQITKLAETGVDIIKIGFFQTDDYQPCLDALRPLAQTGIRLIAVLFAETTYPKVLIAAIKNAGFIGVMLDTANKNGLTLLDYYSAENRREFANNVFKLEMQLGLAGSLKLQHIDLIKDINPSYIGFRGGVCDDNQRHLALDASKIKAIRKTM